MLRSLKKTTIQSKIIGSLISGGVNPALANIVFAQACHETGNFTSPVFLLNNNCFGMRPPQEYIIATGEQFGYAKYNSIEDSAQAMSVYLSAHGITGNIQTVDQYVNSLHDQAYFEADLQEYINGVTYFYNLYFGQ